jgi:hypothetical protein
MTFKHWLRTQPLRKLPHGPQGDFVRDANAFLAGRANRQHVAGAARRRGCGA